MKRLRYPVVAFAGAMGSGKTTAAGVLREVVSLRRMSFAQPIRAMLEALGVPAERLSDPVLKAEPIAWHGMGPGGVRAGYLDRGGAARDPGAYGGAAGGLAAGGAG
jgi:hypothetical protein